jgi:hypothetical protein
MAEVGTAVAAAALIRGDVAGQATTPITVYKSATCTCCQQWVTHMAANGFAPTVTNSTEMTAIKRRHNVAPPLQSCHTSLVGGYVIEGHVPAADVKRLLAAKPAGVIGLTIPGMPPSAPGMDMTPFQPFTVLTFDAKGGTTTFARHTRSAS